MGKRNLYLKTIPVEEAQALYQDALKAIAVRRTEKIPVEESLGRMTAKAIYARCCSPLFNAAAMDGIAVIAKETAGATQENPLTLVRGKDYQIVDTGDPVHPPYDAVIMAEDLLEAEEDVVQIMEAASGWQHVRPIGEDIVAGEMLLPGSHKIRPIDIGVLLSGGILEVEVIKRPRVGLIPTGTEIIEPDKEPGEGDIIESNSRMFAAMTINYGGIPRRYAPVVTRAGIHADGLLKNEEIYNIFDTEKFLNKPPRVAVSNTSGLAGIAHWINTYYRLTGEAQVDKNSALVQKVKAWVDQEYESGRVTVLTDEELTAVIETACRELGIRLD